MNECINGNMIFMNISRTIDALNDPLTTGDTLLCSYSCLNFTQTSSCTQYSGNISSKFSSKSEANASKLIENLEELFNIVWTLQCHYGHYNVITITRLECVR